MKRIRLIIGILGAANLIGAIVGVGMWSVGYAAAYSGTVAAVSQLSPDFAPGSAGYETMRSKVMFTVGHSSTGKPLLAGLPVLTGLVLLVIASRANAAEPVPV